MNNRESFYAEARWQGACAVTGEVGPDWEAHHVLKRQHCRAAGAAEWDPRNALRLKRSIHKSGLAEGRLSEVQTRNLRDENIEFVVESLGVGPAIEYLRRYYDDDSDPDPRLIELEHEWEATRDAA